MTKLMKEDGSFVWAVTFFSFGEGAAPGEGGSLIYIIEGEKPKQYEDWVML